MKERNYKLVYVHLQNGANQMKMRKNFIRYL